jgi:hypothetical protein
MWLYGALLIFSVIPFTPSLVVNAVRVRSLVAEAITYQVHEHKQQHDEERDDAEEVCPPCGSAIVDCGPCRWRCERYRCDIVSLVVYALP